MGGRMKVLTATQMREIDRLTSEQFGVPSLQLMENAGARVVEFLIEHFPDLVRRKVVILCGKGNNGGDGLVVGRLLRGGGVGPTVFFFSAPEAGEGDAAVDLKRWQDSGGEGRVITRAAPWEGA